MAIKTNKPLKLSWIVCPNCGLRKFYHRRKTDDFACEMCPTLFRADYQHKITYLIPNGKESK